MAPKPSPCPFCGRPARPRSLSGRRTRALELHTCSHGRACVGGYLDRLPSRTAAPGGRWHFRGCPACAGAIAQLRLAL